MKEVFPYKTSHLLFQTNENVLLTNCFFIDCSAENGGGFLSDVLIVHNIRQCFFITCSATEPSQGRGGGFLVRQGKLNAKFCCANECKSTFGSDLMTYPHSNIVTQFNYIQSYKSNNNHHGMWLMSGNSDSHFKNMNISSSTSVKENSYGNGLNLCVINTPSSISFINLIDNHKCGSVLEFESADHKEIELYYINIINNKEQSAYISFYGSSFHSSKAIFHNSLLIGNDGNDFFIDSTGSCSVEFHNCAFSIKEPTTEQNNVAFSHDCSFSQTLPIGFLPTFGCIFDFKFSCKAKWNIHFFTRNLIFVSFYILIS